MTDSTKWISRVSLKYQLVTSVTFIYFIMCTLGYFHISNLLALYDVTVSDYLDVSDMFMLSIKYTDPITVVLTLTAALVMILCVNIVELIVFILTNRRKLTSSQVKFAFKIVTVLVFFVIIIVTTANIKDIFDKSLYYNLFSKLDYSSYNAGDFYIMEGFVNWQFWYFSISILVLMGCIFFIHLFFSHIKLHVHQFDNFYFHHKFSTFTEATSPLNFKKRFDVYKGRVINAYGKASIKPISGFIMRFCFYFMISVSILFFGDAALSYYGAPRLDDETSVSESNIKKTLRLNGTLDQGCVEGLIRRYIFSFMFYDSSEEHFTAHSHLCEYRFNAKGKYLYDKLVSLEETNSLDSRYPLVEVHLNTVRTEAVPSVINNTSDILRLLYGSSRYYFVLNHTTNTVHIIPTAMVSSLEVIKSKRINKYKGR
ncbi:hypothetical protein [Vibrio sp. WXL103]|uniref:hypothetical protein n=1 Tax=Vibrio sp. WXL103 TaxID=3450710 RepID=UPI003EC880B9